MWTDRQTDLTKLLLFCEIIRTRLKWWICFRALSALPFLKNLWICIAPQCCPMLSDHRSTATLPVDVGFAVEKVALEQGFLSFSRSVKFHLPLKDTIPQRQTCQVGET